MGNTPGKEERPRSTSYPYTGPFTPYAIEGRTRRNTTSVFNLDKKSKKQEEKERQREYHFLQLIVKYSETVDGGYLAPYGTYKSNLEFNTDVVRRLIISRKLAPFYTPLQDFNDDWTDEELLILVKQLPLHALEGAYEDETEEDDADDHKIHKSSNFYKRQEQKKKLSALLAKIKDLQKLEEENYQQIKSSDKSNRYLPSDSLLLTLYRNVVECPICFVFYPDNLNLSRCCLQPICTECFVQIKRLDPHPAHEKEGEEEEGDLISEPANCPYCAMTDFGVIFDKNVDFTTGIDGSHPSEYTDTVEEEAILSASSSNEDQTQKIAQKRRRSSIPANSPKVVTVDQIRPDWETKLQNAKNKLARKAAAASAIHASNLIINPETEMPEYDTRRRRNTTGQDGMSSSVNSNSIQSMEDRMIEEALRLSIIDEEERMRRERK